MPEQNLRPRVQEFSPFRRVEPSVGGGDTYAQPGQDFSKVRELTGTLEDVRALSPFIDRYVQRQFTVEQQQLQDEAQSAVANLTPDQIRAESAKEWEAFSRETKFDNRWWGIYLDEAAGKRMAGQFDVALRSRGLEASDPAHPDAHFKIIAEERDKLTQGMNGYQLAAFDQQAQQIANRAASSWAESREARYQSQMESSFRDTVMNLTSQALDPALGGKVNLEALTSALESERARSGNDGRAELLNAAHNALTLQVAEADTSEQLDAVRVQAAAVIAELGGLSLAEGMTLDEQAPAELDGLELLVENQTRTRFDQLMAQDNGRKKQAQQQIDDEALSLSAQVFNGEITDQQANAAIATKVREVSAGTGISESYLTGHALISMREQSAAVDGSRFARETDPDVESHLRSLALAPGFDSGWYGVALAGALENRSLSRESYAALLELGSTGNLRQAQQIAEAHTNAQARSLGDRALEQAKPFLDSIVDPVAREQATAQIVAGVDAALAGERDRLAGSIRAMGLEKSMPAIDAWTKDYLSRSGALVTDILQDVQATLPEAVQRDPSLAFRARVQANPSWNRALEKWTFDYALSRLDDATAGEAVGAQPGDFVTVGDAAVRIAQGRATTEIGFNLKREAEEAFLAHLEEATGLTDEGVGRAILSADAILRTQNFVAPAPEKPAAAAPDKAKDAADLMLAGLSEEQKKVLLPTNREQEINAKIAAMEASGAHPALIEQERRTLTAIEIQKNRTRQIAYQSSVQDINRAMESLTRPSAIPGKRERVIPTVGGPNLLIEVRDGHVYPVGRGSVEGAIRIESDFLAGKLWTGLTLEEVREGKAQIIGIGSRYAPLAGPPEKIVLDRRLIDPALVPFFKSVAELESADLTEWLPLFPGYTPEQFRAVQRQVIQERIPESDASAKEAPQSTASDYDMKSAKAAGLAPDETGHWPSRVPSGAQEGLLLKSENHPTFNLTIKGEKDAGYTIYRRKSDGRLYSFKSGAKVSEDFQAYP